MIKIEISNKNGYLVLLSVTTVIKVKISTNLNDVLLSIRIYRLNSHLTDKCRYGNFIYVHTNRFDFDNLFRKKNNRCMIINLLVLQIFIQIDEKMQKLL